MCTQFRRWAWVFFVISGLSVVASDLPKKDAPAKTEPAAVSDDRRVSLSTHLQEIKMRLADKSPAIRRSAMPLIEAVRREESGPLLLDLAIFDEDPEIRMEAFRQLCLFPDTEGKITQHLSQVFRKESIPWVKQSMAADMTRLPFKHAVLTEFVYYILAMRDPDHTVWDNQYDNRGKVGGGTSGGRNHFSLIVQALNTVSGRNFPANRETSTQVAEWWKINSFDYEREDAERALKLRTEGVAGMNLTPAGAADEASAKEGRSAQGSHGQSSQGTKEVAGMLGADEENNGRKPASSGSNRTPAEDKSTRPLSEDDIE